MPMNPGRSPIFSLLLLILFTLPSCRQTDKAEPVPEKPVEQDEKKVAELIPEERYSKDFIMGKFNPQDHPDFTQIDIKYADREGLMMQVAAYKSFQEMWEAAARDGIELIIRSATRNFYRQKQIWEAKWTGQRLVEEGENLAISTPDSAERAKKILRWSSMPGTSRHHWGTDIDLNDFTNRYFEQGKGKKEYDWLLEHAIKFGFCQVYTEKNEERPFGYNEEKWHWSYIPLAKEYTDYAKAYLNDADISGFYGAGTAIQIGVKQKYILGISKKCL